jgi:hypothetical protein
MIRTLKLLIIAFVLSFFTSVTFSQNSFTECDFPVEQRDINHCIADSIDILWVSDTNVFLDEVRNCVNITTLVLNQTTISNIPQYFENFKKLKKLILLNIKTVPTSIDYIPNLDMLKLVQISDLKFPDTFFDSLYLRSVSIQKCKNLYINNINCEYLNFYSLYNTWNRCPNFRFKSKIVELAEVDFTLTTRWLKNIYLEEIFISHCKNVRLTNSFFTRFPELKKLEMEL